MFTGADRETSGGVQRPGGVSEYGFSIRAESCLPAHLHLCFTLRGRRDTQPIIDHSHLPAAKASAGVTPGKTSFFAGLCLGGHI